MPSMVTEQERARRRAKLAELSKSIRADIIAIRIAQSRILPPSGQTFEEEMEAREAQWAAEDPP